MVSSGSFLELRKSPDVGFLALSCLEGNHTVVKISQKLPPSPMGWEALLGASCLHSLLPRRSSWEIAAERQSFRLERLASKPGSPRQSPRDIKTIFLGLFPFLKENKGKDQSKRDYAQLRAGRVSPVLLHGSLSASKQCLRSHCVSCWLLSYFEAGINNNYFL